MKASWDEAAKANLQNIKDVVQIYRDIIVDINQIQYHLRGTDRKKLIGLPDPEFLGNPFSNTQLTLINTSTLLNYEQTLDFNKLNALAQCFHKT